MSPASPEVVPVSQCPLCGHDDRRIVLGRWGDPLAVTQCTACELLYAAGRYHEHDLEHLYGTPRAFPPDPQTRERKRRSLALYDRLVEGRLLRPNPGARALDIGCHNGALLDELRCVGYETAGIERSTPLAEVARRRHHVYELDVNAPGLNLGRPFDLITMTHVLEHIERPIATLRFIERHLAPGGVVVIEVPNWEDPARRLWGRRYRPLELGDHVAFYERSSLSRALEHAGLAVRSLWSQPQAASLIVPSLLSAADLGMGLFRRATAERTGVAAARTDGRKAPGVLRHLALELLDRLDPLLARATSPRTPWGANLVAVASRSPDALH